MKMEPGMMVHAYNPIYVGGGDREDFEFKVNLDKVM
jgi:hypothetical protein